MAELKQAELLSAIKYQQAIKDLHLHLHAVNRFPRGAQVEIINAFFKHGKMVILAQCGRDAGKTEAFLYIVWRFALTHDDVEIFIICPERAQGKKIYWDSNRLPNYGPQKYVADKLRSAGEMRLIFTNGSSVRVDGCENWEALRGPKPKLVLYDEKQHHTQFFDEEVMQPNLARGNVALIAAGTPPKRYCNYVEFRKDIVEEVSNGNSRYCYIELPTWANPLADRQWLADKKKKLFAKGKQNVWYREYEGKLLFDTESAILPYWDRYRHMVSEDKIRELLGRDHRRLLWYAVFDPGTSTCFAVLFIAVNPYTGEVFLLDEIYETQRGQNSALKIWERANRFKTKWYSKPEAWVNIYDVAATWFPNEILADYSKREEQIESGFIPSNKTAPVKAEEGRAGESVLNSLMEAASPQLFYVNAACESFGQEIESFITDDTGKYPTNFDHLVDDLFYWVNTTGYTVSPHIDEEAKEREHDKEYYQGESLESYIGRQIAKRDWIDGIEDFYDHGEFESWN